MTWRNLESRQLDNLDLNLVDRLITLVRVFIDSDHYSVVGNGNLQKTEEEKNTVENRPMGERNPAAERRPSIGGSSPSASSASSSPRRVLGVLGI